MTTDDEYYSEAAATLGDRIAAARENAGLSQTDLAERLGVKRKTVLDWENDQAEPRANKLQMLSGVLNVSMRWMLTGVGSDVSAPQGEGAPGIDVAHILTELRELRAASTKLTERITQFEIRLRQAASKHE